MLEPATETRVFVPKTCTMRFRQNDEREILRTGVSHDYAVEWCEDASTKGADYFDGWWWDE